MNEFNLKPGEILLASRYLRRWLRSNALSVLAQFFIDWEPANGTSNLAVKLNELTFYSLPLIVPKKLPCRVVAVFPHGFVVSYKAGGLIPEDKVIGTLAFTNAPGENYISKANFSHWFVRTGAYNLNLRKWGFHELSILLSSDPFSQNHKYLHGKMNPLGFKRFPLRPLNSFSSAAKLSIGRARINLILQQYIRSMNLRDYLSSKRGALIARLGGRTKADLTNTLICWPFDGYENGMGLCPRQEDLRYFDREIALVGSALPEFSSLKEVGLARNPDRNRALNQAIRLLQEAQKYIR